MKYFKLGIIALLIAAVIALPVSASTPAVNQFNYGVVSGSSDVTQVAVNAAAGSSGAISQVNNLYTYDSHGITQVAVNGLLDSKGVITQQNVGTVQSGTVDSVQVLANVGVDTKNTVTQGNQGTISNSVGAVQVLGNIDDPAFHYNLNGAIYNLI